MTPNQELEAAAEEYGKAQYPHAKYPTGSGCALVQRSIDDFLAGAAYQANKAQVLVDGIKEQLSTLQSLVDAYDCRDDSDCDHCVAQTICDDIHTALAAYEEGRAAPPDMQEPKKFELGSTITENDLKP